MKTTTALIIALSFGAILTGCEGAQSEKDMIAEAQFCLDEANDEASANSCLSKISGLTSPQAYTLRCAGGFVAAQITSPANLSKALNAIKDGQGAPALLSSLSFADRGLANKTFDNCNKSSRSGLKLIGAMAKSATILANVANGLPSCSSPENCDASAIESTLTDLVSDIQANDPAAEETVIEIVSSIQTVYASTCSGTNNSNSDICGQINTAISTSGYDINTTDPTEILAIGKELLSQWQN